jgi:hypothetical protein
MEARISSTLLALLASGTVGLSGRICTLILVGRSSSARHRTKMLTTQGLGKHTHTLGLDITLHFIRTLGQLEYNIFRHFQVLLEVYLTKTLHNQA